VIHEEGDMTTERKVACKCQHCGNEAEMTVSCEVEDVGRAGENAPTTQSKVPETFTCVYCGTEAGLIESA
jgi:transcription elongation factor Elf1